MKKIVVESVRSVYTQSSTKNIEVIKLHSTTPSLTSLDQINKKSNTLAMYTDERCAHVSVYKC